MTSGETICELLPTYSRVKPEHREGFAEPLVFLAHGETASGSPAVRLTVKFSNSKTEVFTYGQESGLYQIEVFDAPYLDVNTGEQVAVKNILVLYTDIGALKGTWVVQFDGMETPRNISFQAKLEQVEDSDVS